MKKSWRFLLRKSLPPDSLSGVGFSVFGLGDSSYPIYNAVARRLHQRLLDLGAAAIHERGLGDDQHELGVDAALDEWLNGLWGKLLTMYPLPPHLSIADEDEMTASRYRVRLVEASGDGNDGDIIAEEEASSSLHAIIGLGKFGHGVNVYQPVSVPVIENRRLTPEDHFQDVRHIELSIESRQAMDSLHYEPGDVLVVHPTNPRDIVLSFIEEAVPSLQAFTLVEVETIDAKAPDLRLPSRLTLFDLFSRFLDICGTPRRHFFEVLWFCDFLFIGYAEVLMMDLLVASKCEDVD